jgi:hypothetical protein
LDFNAVVKTITSYLDGILDYIKYRLTNAASEALNTKIIKRRAYEFHDLDFQAEDPASMWEVILNWEKCPKFYQRKNNF